jgi:propionyl-CoA carboxylase alpha chain
VMTPREYELSKHMLEKKAPDFSKMLISPMPGALVSLNVKEGDHVVVGQEICVMEAMKMQNVLTAEMTGYVKKVYHKPGATLAVDEVIVEFTDEKEE